MMEFESEAFQPRTVEFEYTGQINMTEDDDRTDGKDTGLRNAEGKAVMFKVWVDS